jgi:cytochrome c-type biogenesis protein CcmH/NrfF
MIDFRLRLRRPFPTAGVSPASPLSLSLPHSSSDPRAVTRAALVFSLLLLLLTPATAQQTDRAKALGHRLICMCGCKQILVECNHVSCPVSPVMLRKLDAEIASGKSDDLILQSFVQEYGAEVLAEPPAKGFNWLAWIMPFAVLGAGFFVVRTVIARWYQPVPASSGADTPAGPDSGKVRAPAPEMLARIREESEEDQD